MLTRILVLAACSFALGACQDDEEKAVEHLNRGSAYQKAGDYPAAIIEYKNVLQLDPNNAAAHWGLAKGYLANQQIPEGFWELRETVRLDPDNLDARAQLSQLLLLAGDPDEALAQAEELLSRGGKRGHIHRAQALDRLDRFDEALEEYEQAIAATPDESAPVLIYAQALTRNGDREAAEPYFLKLVEMDPSVSSYTSLAAFYVQDRGRDEDTERAFLEATRVAEGEDQVRAHQNVASFYFQRERFDEAIAYLARVIPTVEQPVPLIYLLARLHVAQGDTEKADALIAEATEIDPTDPVPYLTLSGHLGRQGDVAGALAAAEKALEIDPNLQDAKLRVAEILVDVGYRDGDEEKVQRGQQMVKEVLDEGTPSASALMVMAKIDLAQQRVDEAIEGLRAAIELDPNNSQAHFVLGTALSVKGEGPAARTELARALEIDPGLLEARRVLARVHASLGEHEYAVEEGRRYLAGQPESTQTRILLAQSLVILRRMDAALAELNAIPEQERNADVLYALGRVHLGMGKDAEARKYLTAAHELMPTHHDILRNLVRLDQKENRFAESVARVDEAVQSEPENAKLRTLSGLVALMDDRGEDAEKAFQKAIELDPTDSAGYEQLARLYAKTGRLSEAVTTYEAAIEARPEDPNLHYFLGTLYAFGGAQDKAIERYEDAIRYGPDLAYPKNDLAYIYAESGENLDRALDLAQDAKAALPDTATVADTLGWVLYKRGIPSAAISYLKEAVANSDGDIAVAGISMHHLAQAYEADGNPEKARETLRRAIAELEKAAAEQRASGEPVRPEPAWAEEVRSMLARLERDG
ncbi:MAG: tetratricopeptide repeat protein [Deltaproteobacteria bacterium]|nr:tetratricopeptide repeat protein [Deltaproteobacteria bacterium]